MLRPSYWVRDTDTSSPSLSTDAVFQVFPIISGLVWLGTLLALLIYWSVDAHFQKYASMEPTQSIAYISDVAAQTLKPLFIAGCCVTTLFLDLSFLSDRWLRHRGRLVPETTVSQKVLSGLTIFFALIGTCGLILLSIFDTLRYMKLHDIFLLLFIAGYVISAIFICLEYQRLGTRKFSVPCLTENTGINNIRPPPFQIKITNPTASSGYPSTSNWPLSSSKSPWQSHLGPATSGVTETRPP